MVVWRLARSIYRDLSGIGGIKHRGRWNEAGAPIIYTSGSLALSVLERRVHAKQQPRDDVSLKIEIPDKSIQVIAPLPESWKDNLEMTRTVGSDWLRSRQSLCLRVPSAIVPEFNYLINPLHEEIRYAEILEVKLFAYDSRLYAAD